MPLSECNSNGTSQISQLLQLARHISSFAKVLSYDHNVFISVIWFRKWTRSFQFKCSVASDRSHKFLAPLVHVTVTHTLKLVPRLLFHFLSLLFTSEALLYFLLGGFYFMIKSSSRGIYVDLFEACRIVKLYRLPLFYRVPCWLQTDNRTFPATFLIFWNCEWCLILIILLTVDFSVVDSRGLTPGLQTLASACWISKLSKSIQKPLRNQTTPWWHFTTSRYVRRARRAIRFLVAVFGSGSSAENNIRILGGS